MKTVDAVVCTCMQSAAPIGGCIACSSKSERVYLSKKKQKCGHIGCLSMNQNETSWLAGKGMFSILSMYVTYTIIY